MPNGLSPHLKPDPSRILRRAQRAHDGGAFDEAERLYNAVLQYHANNFDALHGLGLIHYHRGRIETALILVQAALKSDLTRADGFASLGLVFQSLNRFKEALVSYEEGLRIAPLDPELLNRCGVALLELGRPKEALAKFERVLAVDPDRVDALGNSGNAFLKLNRAADALAVYDRALILAPGNAQLLTNRAVALRRLDRPREAVMSAGMALVSNPQFAQARFVESVARLTLGDFGAGWRGYEARWAVGFLAAQRRQFTAPLWLGEEPIAGKTILLHAEQGFGDTLQFVRYAPLVARRGATVILEVQPELARLLSSMPGVAKVIARGGALPAFDCHCPLMSLPLACGTELATIPAEVPYISLDVVGHDSGEAAPWRNRRPRSELRVGLAWSGERTHDNDLNRSLPLETLKPLLDLSGIAFVSLQHTMRNEDIPLARSHPNLLVSDGSFRDFADTAAAIAPLDIVVAADTAVAHLAGAMAKPLFLLLPFAADFRWLRERQDSPWYPSARLFRQPKSGDWASPIEALRRELRSRAFSSPLRQWSA